MKELEDYTEKEWLEMAQWDVENLIKFTAINRCIPIPEKPEFIQEEYNVEVNRFFRSDLFPNMYFSNAETLDSIINIVKDNDNVKFGEQYKYFYHDGVQVNKILNKPKESLFKVDFVHGVDEDVYEKIEVKLKEKNKREELYKTQLKEYRQACTEINEIRDFISTQIEKAHYNESLRVDFSSKFEKDYMPLISDTRKALELFTKTYKLDQFVVDYIVEKYNIQ